MSLKDALVGQCDCCGETEPLPFRDRHGSATCVPCHQGGQCDWTSGYAGCEKGVAVSLYGATWQQRGEWAPRPHHGRDDTQLEQDVAAAIASIRGEAPMPQPDDDACRRVNHHLSHTDHSKEQCRA